MEGATPRPGLVCIRASQERSQLCKQARCTTCCGPALTWGAPSPSSTPRPQVQDQQGPTERCPHTKQACQHRAGLYKVCEKSEAQRRLVGWPDPLCPSHPSLLLHVFGELQHLGCWADPPQQE